MSTEIVPFHFQGVEVRTLTIDGEPWWVAADVAKALGIVNGRNMVARLDGDEKGVRLVDTLGGPQNLTIISESGLYSASIRPGKHRRYLRADIEALVTKPNAAAA